MIKFLIVILCLFPDLKFFILFIFHIMHHFSIFRICPVPLYPLPIKYNLREKKKKILS